MTVVDFDPKKAWRRGSKPALKQDVVRLERELAELGGRYASACMMLHAMVIRHGTQLFSVEKLERCDPGAVHVDIDYARDRAELRLTSAKEE